jgi:hypothetical protein
MVREIDIQVPECISINRYIDSLVTTCNYIQERVVDDFPLT